MECSKLPPGAFPTPRRVFTAPTSLSAASLVSSQNESLSSSASRSSHSEGVETLYRHPSVKIIAFTSSAGSVPSTSYADEPGTLPWSSQLERTIAVGAFRIYRAPGSVAFLNCGSALQPILPKSQCWCIEENSSRFVLQIRRPSFWRIELPVTDIDDRHRAELLKDVFARVLMFEKTYCPFQRSFTVKLPSPPQTPVRKKPWTPARYSSTPAGRGAPGIGVLRSPSTDSKKCQAASEPLIEGDIAEDVTKVFEDPRQEKPLASNPAETGIHTCKRDTELRRVDVRNYEMTEGGMESGVLQGVIGNKHMEESDGVVGRLHSPTVEEMARIRRPSSKPVTLGHSQNSECSSGIDSGQGTWLNTPQCLVSSSRMAVFPKPEVGEADKMEYPVKTLGDTPVKSRTATPVKVREVVEAIEERLPEKDVIAAIQLLSGTPASSIQEPDSVSTATKLLACKTSIPFIRNVGQPRRRESSEAFQALLTPSPPVKPPAIPESIAMTGSGATQPGETQGSNYDNGTNKSDKQAEKDEADEAKEIIEGSGHGGDLLLKKKLRRNGFATIRASTAPPQLTLVTSPPSKPASKRSAVSEIHPSAQPPAHARTQSHWSHTKKDERKRRSDSTSTDSADSFHSLQSETWLSPVTSSVSETGAGAAADAGASADTGAAAKKQSMFPYTHDNIVIPQEMTHHQPEMSDLTVTPTPDSRLTWDEMSMSSGEISLQSAMTAPDRVLEPIDECAKSTISDDLGCSTAVRRGRGKSSLGHRTTTSISTRGTFSPLPPPAALFSPTATSRRKPAPGRTRMELVRRIPFTIIAKTCELLFGPPAHLVALMLKVAAKIVAGEWRGLVFGFGDDGERINVEWDYSDDGLSDWENDERTSPLYRSRRVEELDSEQDDAGAGRRVINRQESDDEWGRSWGVD